VAKFALAYISNLAVSVAALRTTRALRQDFLNGILRKEAWHFDSQNASSVAVLVTINGSRINNGIADKLASFFQNVTTFFAVFIVALAVQWKLALISLCVIPAMIIVMAICIPPDAKVESQVMRIYSKGASMAQEAISSIRTVHAFWAQPKLIQKYDDFLQQAHTAARPKSLLYGVFFSTQYFCIYCGVALAFWEGYRIFDSGEVSSVGPVFTYVPLTTAVVATF